MTDRKKIRELAEKRKEDEKKFYEALDEEYEDENFRSLEDNRKIIKEIRKEFPAESFPEGKEIWTLEQVREHMAKQEYD